MCLIFRVLQKPLCKIGPALIAGFQFFRNSLCICRLFCKPKKKFLCLSVNICKIFG